MSHPQRIVVVSGLSGAGKSHTLKCLEDFGYFCVDNLPPSLLPMFVDLCTQSANRLVRLALGIDIREQSFLEDFWAVFERMKGEGFPIELMFLEARDEVLIRRFSESRRPHPLAQGHPLMEGIRKEREHLSRLREKAELVMDTSALTVHQLREVLERHFTADTASRRLLLTLVSFGYKNGIPHDADLLFDVRFLPNPNFVQDLRPLDGRNPRVAGYVLGRSEALTFLDKLSDWLRYLLPSYQKEGRAYLTIGIGCTGGQHRSVVIADRIGQILKQEGYEVVIRHRDIPA
jgi:UPF0042 nucleotide-binding protein